MSLGFEMAGFSVEAASEFDEWASETYRHNHPNARLITGDIRKLAGTWNSIVGTEIDGVVGGPACQGHSLCGSRDPNDPRNSLFTEFVKCVYETKPKFFVMENVTGILSSKTNDGMLIQKIICREFDAIGYDLDCHVLDASDFGVPQSRKRVFFVGFRSDVIGERQWNHPYRTVDRLVTVDEAISDLPLIAAGEGSEEMAYDLQPSSDYQRWARAGSYVVRNHVAMRHTPRLVERFKAILPGQSVANVSAEHSAVKRGDASVKSGKVFGQNNFRVFGNKPCPTVPASFQSNFIHPTLNRNFTAREGARLQSFPDRYVFKGERTTMSWEKRLSQYKQIGNAVPPLLAKALAESIRKFVEKGC